MLFNSIDFIVFFIVVFFIYWFVLQRHLKFQNIFLLLSSYIFYGWWDWRFLSLIVISSATDFYLGLRIYKSQDNKIRKKLLLLSLFVNLGILGFFKYFDFFTENLVSILSQININTNYTTLNIILPIGISFYTFQTLSYTIDIYKRKMEPTKDIVNFFAFVAFFPQLVAGPIERAKHLLPQFSVARKFDYNIARSGGKLILIGLFKKICVADSLALFVDAAYDNPEYYTGFPMMVATIFFAFQIYCDFSGYSDIAIGTARILGFDIMTNFKTPYFAKSLTAFWRRWHISLSTWFRDYVYIPLGGSRVGNYKMMSNIFITFILSGLWHGANWTYIVWGAIHGIFLMIEKLFFNSRARQENLIRNGLSMAFTFLIVCFAWIFFRSNTISDAYYIITHMFSDISDWTNIPTILFKFKTMGLKVIGMKMTIAFIIIFLVMEVSLLSITLKTVIERYYIIRWTGYILLLILIIISASRIEAENFIYFQF